LSSVGIIIAAVAIMLTGYYMIDPIMSMVIGVIIFVGGAKIICESYLVIIDSVPTQFELDQIRNDRSALDGVQDVHELHLWSVSTDHYSLTAHVFVGQSTYPLHVISLINAMLKEKYNIIHSTIQVEHPAIHDHSEYEKRWGREERNSKVCWQSSF